MSDEQKHYETVLGPSRLTVQYLDCSLLILQLLQKQTKGSDQQVGREKVDAGVDD